MFLTLMTISVHSIGALILFIYGKGQYVGFVALLFAITYMIMGHCYWNDVCTKEKIRKQRFQRRLDDFV